MGRIWAYSMDEFDRILEQAKEDGDEVIASGVMIRNPETREVTMIMIPQKKRIEAYCKNVAYEAAQEVCDRDMRIMFDLYIKMVCVTLHDAFGFGEKRLNMFLGNHKRLFHRQMKMVKNGTQIEYLNRRMSEIFRKEGFPQDFFDAMLGPVPNEEE